MKARNLLTAFEARDTPGTRGRVGAADARKAWRMRRLPAIVLFVLSGPGLIAPGLAQVDVCAGRTVHLSQGPVSELIGPTSAAVFQTTAAENFLLDAPAAISRIMFLGFYGEPAEPETFSVIFRGDESGNPSFVDVGPTLNGLVPTRWRRSSDYPSRDRCWCLRSKASALILSRRSVSTIGPEPQLERRLRRHGPPRQARALVSELP